MLFSVALLPQCLAINDATRHPITTSLCVILALTRGSMIDEGESCIFGGGALSILGICQFFSVTASCLEHPPTFPHRYNVNVPLRCNTATLGGHSRNCHGFSVSAATEYDV